MTTLGGLIPAMLAARGFDTVFGIPGVHTVEMYRGLAGSGLRHVTPRHEQGAGFMADGYARATGRPAACFIITGPGMTNIATAMGQAHGDSIPMLVISSVGPAALRGRGGLHEMKDQLATLSGMSGLSLQVEDAAGLAAALDQALDLFASARPRPVHIQIPTDRLAAEAGAAPPPRAPAAPPAAPEAALVEAVAILNRAARPLLVIGGGARGLGADALRLAEALGALVLMTANGRGLLPPAHPLNAGGELFAEGARRLIAESDAALALGCEFGPTDWAWNGEPDPEFGGPLIRVDIDAAQLRIGPPAALAVHAEAAGFARALLPLVARAPAAPRRLPAPGAGLEPRIARHLPLLEAIWKAMPEAMIFGDSTEPAYAAHAAARPPATGLWASSATGFGTLGYALPAAIGAALAAPGRPAVALAGDGGALFTIAELAAAAEARAPVALLLWNNAGYGEIRWWMEDAGVAPEGVALSPVDFAALAKGFGAGYARARDVAEAVSALRAVSGGPVLIEMREGEFRFG